MGIDYDFYKPLDMGLIESGRFALPDFVNNDINIYWDTEDSIDCVFTCIINRKDAIKLDKQMNSTLLNDLMDNNNTDSLIIRGY